MSDTLQQGLLAEEVHHDLDAAIAAYRSVVAQHDEQRQLAATALFRLGECYRKQGGDLVRRELYEVASRAWRGNRYPR